MKALDAFRKKSEFAFAFQRPFSVSPKVAESAISALVQTNFLMSHFAGVTAIAELDLDSATLQTMAISILVSCCSSGLSFAAKDKKDGWVLGLPGKVDWSPTMVSLVLVRALETGSRMVAFNIVQVSLRGGWCGHLGGPMAVLLFVAAAALCFPEAEISDVLVPWILVSDFHDLYCINKNSTH